MSEHKEAGLAERLEDMARSTAGGVNTQEITALLREAAAALASRDAEIARLREALVWYGKQARLSRLIHNGGDVARHALAADGGARARAALPTPGRGDMKCEYRGREAVPDPEATEALTSELHRARLASAAADHRAEAADRWAAATAEEARRAARGASDAAKEAGAAYRAMMRAERAVCETLHQGET